MDLDGQRLLDRKRAVGRTQNTEGNKKTGLLMRMARGGYLDCCVSDYAALDIV